MTGSSQGSSYPESSSYLVVQPARRVADRAKWSPRGSARGSRPWGRRDGCGPPPARALLRRPVPTGVYARVPCWWSAERWLEHVKLVYERHYLPVRYRLVATTGGGISLRAVLAVATAHAAAADFGTGRNSGPLLGTTGAERGITAATGLGERTITRARTFLRLVGLATEVQEGRQRTLLERLDSAERGDTARGWTAVYALHHTSTYPVDNPVRSAAGQTPDGTPPRSGLVPTPPLGERVVSTGEEREHRGAPRPAQKPKGGPGRRRAAVDARGLLLATRWRQDPDAPAWARFKTPTTWAALLALPAAHDWTARDLNKLLDNHALSGSRVFTHPRNPIGYLSWLLNRVDLADRPCALEDARDAEDAAAAAQRRARQPAACADAVRRRAAGRDALTGPGRAAVQAVLDHRAGRWSQAAARK